MSQTAGAPLRVDTVSLVDGVISDVAPTLGNAALSQRSRDLFNDATDSIRDVVAAQTQLDADLDELSSKRDLLPRAGLERLRREAEAAAVSRASVAGARWDRTMKDLKESLVDDALPMYSRDRESLARQELALAIGEAKGGAARERAMKVVEAGSREAAAVLLRDPFGRTLLEAREVGGRDLDTFMRSARTIAAGLAPEHGATDRERAAGAALHKLGTLGAARGAAGVVRAR